MLRFPLMSVRVRIVVAGSLSIGEDWVWGAPDWARFQHAVVL